MVTSGYKMWTNYGLIGLEPFGCIFIQQNTTFLGRV